jgi:type I restriction enzyme S subunit
MASNWPLVKLGEFVDIKTGHPFKSKLYSEVDGVKLLRGDNIVQGHFRWANVKLWPEELIGVKETEYLLDEGDIILAMDRPWIEAGLKTAQVNNSDLPCLLVQRVARLRTKEADDQDFLRYLISSYWFVQYIKLVQTGTAVPHISTKQIKDFEFNLPPAKTRKQIGYLMKTLDKKIHLIRQTNQTLEQMAQALFKSWFIDFDPVIDNALAAGTNVSDFPEALQQRAELRKKHQKLAGYKPLPDDIRNLFPSEFEYNDESSIGIKGWIPNGWLIKELRDLIDVLETGRRPKGGVSKYKSGVPSVGAESIKGIGNFEYGKTKFVPIDFFSKMKNGKIQDFDVLLYKDGGKPGEFKPRISMFGLGFPFKEFGINEHVFRIRSAELGQHFLYCQLGSQRVFHELSVRGGKAAIPGVNQEEVKDQLFLIPSNSILLNKFNKIVGCKYEAILDKSLASQNLAKIRDTLLPKLISGEVQLGK